MHQLTKQFVGSHRLLYQIRSGRFSQVWAAIDDGTGRRYALKTLLPDFQTDREQIAAFDHEYAVGHKLKHPRVLGADFRGTSKVGPFLRMELCEGLNLRDVLRKDRRALQPWLSSIVAQTCESLIYLHSQGWMHLDLKPDNFMLTPDGDVRLIDFGLARRLPTGWERFFWRRRNKSIQGTRSYMAPEQIQKQPLDYRTDVYGLGCALYHMAAGVAPFTASSTNELLTKHLIFPIPDARTDNPDLTPAFADLLRRMLAKKPEKRPQTVGDVLKEIQQITVRKEPEAVAG